MKDTEETKANVEEWECERCGGAHPDRNWQIGREYALEGGLCPEKPLSDGGLCDRCDGDLSRETASRVSHREAPSDEFLIVCERCVKEVQAGATF